MHPGHARIDALYNACTNETKPLRARLSVTESRRILADIDKTLNCPDLASRAFAQRNVKADAIRRCTHAPTRTRESENKTCKRVTAAGRRALYLHREQDTLADYRTLVSLLSLLRPDEEIHVEINGTPQIFGINGIDRAPVVVYRWSSSRISQTAEISLRLLIPMYICKDNPRHFVYEQSLRKITARMNGFEEIYVKDLLEQVSDHAMYATSSVSITGLTPSGVVLDPQGPGRGGVGARPEPSITEKTRPRTEVGGQRSPHNLRASGSNSDRWRIGPCRCPPADSPGREHHSIRARAHALIWQLGRKSIRRNRISEKRKSEPLEGKGGGVNRRVGRWKGVWASGTLAHRTKRNRDSCHFTLAFCESAACYRPAARFRLRPSDHGTANTVYRLIPFSNLFPASTTPIVDSKSPLSRYTTFVQPVP
ncbi:hypothetical protein EVAR_77593_1 [Eumeta japonica]|uniref:Uncharacterized protein n=1 Tax=Eumeta variegata TaxID=151549 RepID=A0A4C1T9E8_EUMVA|nr:hypothetical protein EVAR_77593_1 [Eumeta japonica]